jgi:hypothetical protein
LGMRVIEAIYLLLLACLLASAATLHTDRRLILADPTTIGLDWKATWGGESRDYSYDAAFAGGALYVTGATYGDGIAPVSLLLLRYEENGTIAWSTTYWEGGYTMGRGIAMDGVNLYVAGIHIAGNTSYALLLKYDLDGSVVWEREWKPGPGAKASGIALDAEGNVYVTGYVQETSTENRIFLLKYGASGDLAYSRVYPANGSETAWGLTVGDAVYICGEATRDPATAEETGIPAASALLMRVDLDSDLVWRREARAGLDNVANSVTVGNGVTVAGYASYPNGTSKTLILHYRGDGTLTSTSTIGEAVIEEMAWGVAGSGDYTYVVGHARPIFSDLADASIIKLDANGSILLEHRYVDYSTDRARAVVVEGDDVYVVGETYWRDLDMQVLVIKYTSPNAALSPDVSQVLRLAPVGIGVLLFLLLLVETTDALRRSR